MSDNNKYDTMPFPFDSPSPLAIDSDGLKVGLRDYFAARASENDIGFHYNLIYEKSSYRTSPTREQARYAYADAMLAERQEERE